MFVNWHINLPMRFYELVIKLEEEMHVAAENLDFERAAELRDKVAELRKRI